MINKHQTSIISEKAVLGSDVTIGPYCIINENVKIGNNVNLKAHIYIDGNTTIGDNCTFFPYCSIGTSPQDLKYKGEKSKLKIGNNNIFRENTTISKGTKDGGMKTIIKNNNLFMTGVHIAHDCVVANNVIMANMKYYLKHLVENGQKK